MYVGHLQVFSPKIRQQLFFFFVLIRGWKECACNVFHQTRAVAEAPEKLKKSVSSSASTYF